MIMHGQRKNELSGHNVIKMIPFMEELYDQGTKKERFPGLLDSLTVKTSASQERNFEQIVFIDTPGLADGGLRYRFDVEGVYEWFAKHVDLVCVFLDPVGQALCQKTNAMVNRLICLQCDVKFFMTKGDMFRDEQDQAKCMCQITQTLTASIPPMHGFEMPLIYLPNEARKFSRNVSLPKNQLSVLTDLIQKKLKIKVQNNLARFKQDILLLQAGVKTLQNDQKCLKQKPVQQILVACMVAFHVTQIIFVFSLIDIFFSDKAQE